MPVPKNCGAPTNGASDVRGDAGIGEEMRLSGGGEGMAGGEVGAGGPSEMSGADDAVAACGMGVAARCGPEGRCEGTTCSTSGMEPRADETGARAF